MICILPKKNIWFGSVVTKKLEFLYSIMSLVPSIQVWQPADSYSMNLEFHTPVEWFMQIMYKTWMEGTHDKHNKNSYFFVTTEPNQNADN